MVINLLDTWPYEGAVSFFSTLEEELVYAM